MPNRSGTLTSAQGALTLDTSPNDTLTINVSSGSFSVEHPIGTSLAVGATVSQTFSVGAGQARIACGTGSISYVLSDTQDGVALNGPQGNAVANALVPFVNGIHRIWGLRSGIAVTSPLVATRLQKTLAEAPFDQVRIHFLHYGTTTPTIKVAVAATETIATDTSANIGSCIVGGTAYNVIDSTTEGYGWRTATFAGAATKTLAGTGSVAAADSAAEIVSSDWISLRSVPRADGGIGYPIMVAVYCADAGTQNMSWINATGAAAMRTATAANRGRVVQWSRNSSDAIATPGAGTFSLVEDSVPIVVEYRMRAQTATVMAIGDSNTQEDSIVADKMSNWLHRACADISTPSRPVVPCNVGGSSTTSLVYWREAQRMMNLHKPAVAIYCTFSRNDAPFTDAALTRYKLQLAAGRTAEFLAYCKANGIKAILDTGLPDSTTLSATTDPLRKAFAADVRAMAAAAGAGLIDSAAFFGNGANPEQIVAAYNFGDNIHINEAGAEAKAVNLAAPAIRQALGY